MCIRLSLCLIVILSIPAFVNPAQAQFAVGRSTVENYHVELGAAFWKPDPDLILRTGTSGTDVDFINVFGIEDERFTEFRAVLKPGRKHKIRFQYVPIKYDKDAVLNQTFTYGDRTYTVNVPASADIEWTLWRVGYEWDAVSMDRGFVGVIGELKYNRVKTELSAASIGAFSATDTKAPIPALGGIARGYLAKSLSVTIELTGFKIPKREDFEGKFLDFDLYGTLSLGRNVGVQAGYRSLDVRYLVDDDAGTLKMKGPYFGGLVRF